MNEEPIELDFILDEVLPKHLQGTKRHSNCPNHNVPIVMVLKRNGFPLRPMVFRGVVREITSFKNTGMIAVSKPLEFGYSPSLHFINTDRIRLMEEI